MRIEKSHVIMDENDKMILVKDFAKNYTVMDTMDNPEKIVRVMNDVFNMDKQAEEYVYLIAMTTKCKPISFFEISHGTYNSSLVGIREIMIRALLCGASNIIIIHNHPSGVSEPSKEDKAITEKLEKAAELIGIHFCDHIIIGRGNFFSFRKEKIIAADFK